MKRIITLMAVVFAALCGSAIGNQPAAASTGTYMGFVTTHGRGVPAYCQGSIVTVKKATGTLRAYCLDADGIAQYPASPAGQCDIWKSGGEIYVHTYGLQYSERSWRYLGRQTCR